MNELLAEAVTLQARILTCDTASRDLRVQRDELIRRLVNDGVTKAEIARQLGIKRQAIQQIHDKSHDG